MNKYVIALCMQFGIFQYNVREKCLFGEFEVSYVSMCPILDIYTLIFNCHVLLIDSILDIQFSV